METKNRPEGPSTTIKIIKVLRLWTVLGNQNLSVRVPNRTMTDLTDEGFSSSPPVSELPVRCSSPFPPSTPSPPVKDSDSLSRLSIYKILVSSNSKSTFLHSSLGLNDTTN